MNTLAETIQEPYMIRFRAPVNANDYSCVLICVSFFGSAPSLPRCFIIDETTAKAPHYAAVLLEIADPFRFIGLVHSLVNS